MSPTTYEIGVTGPIPPHLASELGGSTLIEESGETVLVTPLISQARLHDILAKLLDFGLELVEIRTITEHPSEGATPE